MKAINQTSIDAINSKVQNIDFYAYKDLDRIDWDVIAVEWLVEIDNNFWILTKDVCNLIVSNIKNSNQPYNPDWKYSNRLVLNDVIDLQVKYELDTPISFFNWYIYELSNKESNKVTAISLLSQKEISQQITTNTILLNKRPSELVQYIVETILWKTFELKWNLSDEDDRIIKYTSYYKDSAFIELNDLCEYARWYIFYDSYDDKYYYFTEDFLITKMSSWTTEDVEISYENSVLDFNIDITSQNMVNLVTWIYNNYTIKSNFSAYIFNIALEAWETVSIQQKLWTWEFYTWLTPTLESATVWEDSSWDNYAIINPSVIEISLTSIPNGVEWTVTNNHTWKLYCSIDLSWTAYIPEQTEKIVYDTWFINSYWERVKQLSNKYFQDITYLYQWMNTEISTSISWSNLNPQYIVSLDIIWNPQLQLFDKVKFVDSEWNIWNWLVRRIKTNFDLQSGYTNTIELFRTIKS